MPKPAETGDFQTGANTGQNIDRLVTLYRAARRSGACLVVDFYTATVLDSAGIPSLPRPGAGFSNLRVLYTKPHMLRAARAGRSESFRKFRDSEVTLEEIAKAPGKYFLIHRDLLTEDIEWVVPLEKAVYIYSQFKGYLEDESFSKTRAFLDRKSIPLVHVHTSGHASPEDLGRFVKALAPRTLVPIHTFHPERYVALWPSVTALRDGEPWPVV